MDMSNLLFILTPLGIYILIISIRGIRKFSKLKVIYEVPFRYGGGTFSISEDRKYGIYMSGKVRTKSPVAKISPCVHNNITKEVVRLSPCILRTMTTGMDGTGRIELYTFRGRPGQYTMSFIGKGLAIDRATSYIVDKTSPNFDYSSFRIQIREHGSVAILFFCIWGIILGSMAAMSGMILPFML